MELAPEEQERWNEHQHHANSRGAGLSISKEREDEIVEAWKDTPTIANVMRMARTGAQQAYRVLRKRGLLH